MQSYNRVQLLGNVAKIYEKVTTPQGSELFRFVVVTNERWKDKNGVEQERAYYHDIIVWDKLAELCSQFVHKGNTVMVEGSLQPRNVEKTDDKGNITKKRIVDIKASNVIFISRNRTEGEASASSTSDASTTTVASY